MDRLHPELQVRRLRHPGLPVRGGGAHPFLSQRIVFLTFSVLLLAHGVGILALHGFVAGSARWPENRLFSFFRHFYPLLLYAFLYRECEQLNLMFVDRYLDPAFIALEERIFGFQPAVVFMNAFPHPAGQRILLHELLFLLCDDRRGGAGALLPKKRRVLALSRRSLLSCSMCAFLRSSSFLWPDRLPSTWRSQGIWISSSFLTTPLNFRLLSRQALSFISWGFFTTLLRQAAAHFRAATWRQPCARFFFRGGICRAFGT